MTATDELRRMLDEHGVDYAWDGDTIYWSSLDGVPWTVERRHDGNLALYSPKCTPRQAVDATLGSYENELLRNKLADCDKMYTHLCEQLARVKRTLADANAENRKLRELANGMWYCANEAYGMCARVPVGGERPFTCCPLYDFDAKEYRCEKLMQELGIEVDA